MHGLLAGTDSMALVGLYTALGCTVGGAAAYRYWVTRQGRPTFATSLPEASTDECQRGVSRSLVMVGVVASLLIGAASIRAAAAWTAASAPLAVSPASAESLAARLTDEEARSAALQAQLDELRANTADLSGALDTARTRISSDAKTATSLRTRLATAKTRLASLEKSLAAARAAAARAAVAATRGGAATATPAPVRRDDGGESDG